MITSLIEAGDNTFRFEANQNNMEETAGTLGGGL
jgi:hypothetical protein